MFESLAAEFAADRATLVALDVALKATGLLAVAVAVHLALGRRRALVRSTLWNACLVALILIPATSLAVPRWTLPILAPRPTAAQPRPTTVEPAAVRPVAPVDQAVVIGFDPVEAPNLAAVGANRPPGSPPDRSRASEPARVAAPGRWDAAKWVLGGYLAVVALGLIRLVGSALAVGRLRRSSRAVAELCWVEAGDRWCHRLGIRRRVAILRSDRVSVPVVVGWLRPTILLPAALAPEPSPELVAAVLLHELSHVRRGDYGWNLVRKLVGALYWPHPLVWPLGRIIGAVREQACDDLCVHLMGGAAGYRASLIAVASALIRRPESALGLAMAQPTNLGRRLAWIDRTPGAATCLLRWPARVVILASVLLLAGAIGTIELAHAQAPAPPQDAPRVSTPPQSKPGPPDAIEVEVLAQDTGKPLPGAKLKFSRDRIYVGEEADGQGKVRFNLTQRQFKELLSVDAWADGYVQQRYQFAENDARHPRIPSQVTIKLWPGEETLGGRVVDEAGQPIAGVQIRVWGYLGATKDKHELTTWVGATTDAAGQWRCRSFRKMTFAYLYLTHPGYVSDGDRQPRAHGQPQPINPADNVRDLAPLRDFSDVQVMQRGTVVAGRVVDAQNRPVAGAEVGWIEASDMHVFHNSLTLTTTDATGAFRFGNALPRTLMIQVKAGGHAPELHAVDAARPTAPILIKLGPPHRLAGRIVDTAGQPIADAAVFMDTWGGYRTLGVVVRTDLAGRWNWDEAPADPIQLHADATGFRYFHSRQGMPDEAEITLTLRRTLAISGQIRDAVSRKAINDARVDVGTFDKAKGQVVWSAQGEIFSMQGRLQANLDAETPAEYRLRFQAKGYQPYQTRPIQSDEKQLDLDVQMVPATDPGEDAVAGTIRGPDGRPLVGAEVGFSYTSVSDGAQRLATIQIENGRIKPEVGLTIARTDDQGRFSLIREPESAWQSYAVIVTHPDGFAAVSHTTFKANPAITTTPWGRVEGSARIGSNLAPGMNVRYSGGWNATIGGIYLNDQGLVRADAAGRFVVDRILPGEVWVSRSFGDNGNPPTQLNGTLARVELGQTVRADIGGTGRPVVARVALPAGFDPAANYLIYSHFDLQSDRPRVPYPAGLLQKGGNAVSEWAGPWYASAEGFAYRRDWYDLSRARLQPDGTIRVDDVPPGVYRLTLTYGVDPSGLTDRVAFATAQFTIPPIPGGPSDEPVDLGTLHPEPKPRQPAPPPGEAIDKISVLGMPKP